MKTFLSAIFCIAICVSLQCQTNPDQSVNMYFCTFLDESKSFPISASYKHFESWISHAASFGYQWNHSENLINEVEIMPLRFCHVSLTDFVYDSLVMSYDNIGYDSQIYNSSVRYSYSYLKGFNRVDLMVGCAGRLFYYNHRIRPYAPDEYFSSLTAAGIMLEFLPALQCELTGNISIRFDVPLTLADIEFRRDKNKDPSLERRHQISDTIGIYIMDRLFMFRIGLSCKIGDSLK